MSPVPFRCTRFTQLLLFSTLLTGLRLSPVMAQSVVSVHPSLIAQADTTDTPDGERPLEGNSSILSIEGGENLVKDADTAIGQQQYDTAISKLQDARKVFNQLSNFYLQLANSFQGINNVIYDELKNKALTAGESRDDATYKLALLHRAQNQPELAVPLLVQVIRSQNPSSPLGLKAYTQLYELGFVKTPFTPANR